MTASKSSKRDFVTVILAALWAVTIIISLIYIVKDRVVAFDPEQKILSEFSSTLDYLDVFSKLFSKSLNDEKIVLRITDSGCSCNKGSELHWRTLKHTYSSATFKELDVSDLAADIRAMVPSTPMAIVADANAVVLYAGPFSDAIYCSSDNSLIESYLKNSLTMRYVPMATEGCYCKNKSI